MRKFHIYTPIALIILLMLSISHANYVVRTNQIEIESHQAIFKQLNATEKHLNIEYQTSFHTGKQLFDQAKIMLNMKLPNET